MSVAVGLSGGVDSCVTALRLKEAGETVVGVTMTLGRADEAASLASARAAAERLDIPLEVLDLSADWRRLVLDDLREAYGAGRTPNPCVRCNERVKLNALPRWAFGTLGCARFATGHYAQLSPTGEDGFCLSRAVDRGKDQSYFLYRVAPEVLRRLVLPLGGWTKSEVRAYARARGLSVADAGDSQDFCGGDPLAHVARADCPGDVVTPEGRVVGRHRGFWRHTVGQRRGLGIGGGVPYYVLALDAVRNVVVVGTRAQAEVRRFEVDSAAWLSSAFRREVASGGAEAWVKVRSAGEPRGPVTVHPLPGGRLRVEASLGLTGVAPGQSAVFYRGDRLLAGGFIASPAV